MLLLLILAALLGALVSGAQPVQHLTVTFPGGMPGLPVMTGILPETNGLLLTWDGPPGYYQVYQKTNCVNPKWRALGGLTNSSRCAMVSKIYSDAAFKLIGPSPRYAGANVCRACHMNTCRYETNTPHAGAFTSAAFVAEGGQTNTSCLPCHTVGYGLPTGFYITNRHGHFSYNTNLAGVQCENCHGPAAIHASNENNPVYRPQVDLAAEVCGGCHTGTMNPTYEEWLSSSHSSVVPDALQVMSLSTNNISSCGRCHSGSVRLALIDGQNPAVTLTNDFNVAITCAVCHDPHETNSSPAQVRNPVFSTNDFYLTTSDVFTNKYTANTNINLCAQCHNHRGAAWTETDRAPHRSAQYNILLGTIGELDDGSAVFNPGTHAGLPYSMSNSLSGKFYLTNQCVSCHMQYDDPPASAVHSHKFVMTNYDVCLNCHNFEPQLLFQYVMVPAVSNRVYNLKYALDLWGSTVAPAALRAPGVVPWEYTTAGGLTWTTNTTGQVIGWTLADSVSFTGPDATNQALIPTNIMKARFNLYLVLGDGSYGAHNPYFALNLLDDAYDWVLDELGY